MSSKKRLILEIGERDIKLCGISSAKEGIVEQLQIHMYLQAVTAQDIDTVVGAVPRHMYADVVVSFPRSFFLIRFLDLPAHDRDEIRQMLPFQLAKIIPYAIEEISYDFFIVNQTSQGSKIILFVIQDKKMAPVLESLRRHTIDAGVVTINDWGLYQWWLRARQAGGQKENMPSAVIDLDRGEAELIVAEEAGILFSRAFSFSDEQSLSAGINQSLGIFKKEFGERTLRNIVLTGDTEGIDMKRLGLNDVCVIDQFVPFPLARDRIKDKSQIRYSWAAVLGLTQIEQTSFFDVSPRAVRIARQQTKQKKIYTDFLLIFMEIVCIAGFVLFGYIKERREYFNFLDGRLKMIRGEAEAIDGISDKLKVLDREFKNKPAFASILYHVISSLPPDIKLSLFEFRDNGEFSLKGYAQETRDVFYFVVTLNKDSLFKDVKMKYASQVKQKNITGVEFFIYGKSDF